jgi:hypothetical protein
VDSGSRFAAAAKHSSGTTVTTPLQAGSAVTVQRVCPKAASPRLRRKTR